MNIMAKNKYLHSLLFFTALSLAMAFAACSGKTFYEKTDALPDATWSIDTVLSYEIDITDSLQYYNLYINIRNTTDFETQNFYIFMTTVFPDGFSARDTLGCVLCDAHGKWTGKGAGHLRDNHFLLKPKVRFAIPGHYCFYVRQAMRDDEVKGISDFGISLEYWEE